MSIWKKLSKWADAMEKEAEKGRERKKRRKADRRIQRVVTYVDLLNNLHALSGEISKLLESAGALTIQHISFCFKDFGRVLSEKFDHIESWTEQRFGLHEAYMESIIKGHFDAHDGAAEIRHNELRNGMNAILTYMQAAELNNSDRYLQQLERVRLAQVAADTNHDVMFGTMLALNEHLLGILQAKTNEPTLPWLLDNVDSLMALSDALKTLRDNTVPPEMARVKGVTALRSIVDVSSEQASEAVEKLARHWDVAA